MDLHTDQTQGFVDILVDNIYSTPILMGDTWKAVNYVLKTPRHEEQEQIDSALDHALLAWPLIACGEWNAAIKNAHTKPAPPRPRLRYAG